MVFEFKFLRIGAFAVVLFLPAFVFGQGLGSSNGLYKGKTPTKKTSSANVVRSKETTSSSRGTSSKRSSSTRSKKSTKSSTASRTSKKREPVAKTAAPKPRSETNVATQKSKKTNADISVRSGTSAKANKIGGKRVIFYGGNKLANYSAGYEDAIREGNAERNLREYARAEAAYKRAREINAADSRAIYGLGNLYSDQLRWEEAENAYRNAIKLEPENANPYLAIGFVLSQPLVGSNLGQRYLESEKMARRAILLSPNNAIAYDQLGVALEMQGKINDETEAAYRKALSFEPNFALAYAHLGRLLRRNGRIAESAEAYRNAVRLSADAPTMILVAEVMQSQQRYTESEQLLRRALQLDPKNPTGLYLLGRALITRKSYNEAEQVLSKSVQVSPESFVSYTLLGSLYARKGDFANAEKTLNSALKVISNNEKKRLAQEFEYLGDSLLQANRKADAVRVFKKGLALDQSNRSIAGKLKKR
ncbi:MAG: tetratricopeptide repeat protein [Pyrinomonadaceae bacterium]